ncbi:hypothetical protein SAMN05428988_0129 [Chitinophaga sp. YR573]|uniref:DUF7768 domain-containing protein n=1 Tax=Chitinophaga sp. YR573 TaxID=1881040 RepID=UPI0008B5C3D1|nr:DUF4406 domain-containing protein [Chitinophaga sp. YR573]SEV88655.1 hypothetical protein SAMN05428988_0129 [Chitinophaga sp. YR573]
MKIVYIAHPISGDIAGNLEKIRQIVRKINLECADIVPFAPYWVDCHALDDTIPSERERGIKNDTEFFKRGVIDEVWLFGDRISFGMQCEIEMAVSLGISVVNHQNNEDKAS